MTCFGFWLNPFPCLLSKSVAGCHQNHRQDMSERGVPEQDVPRDLHPEVAAASAHHPIIRGDGVAVDDLPGDRVRAKRGDLRPLGGQWQDEGTGGGARLHPTRLGRPLLPPAGGGASRSQGRECPARQGHEHQGKIQGIKTR